MQYALTNCEIYTGNEILYAHAILIAKDTIVGLTSETEIPAEFQQVDLKGLAVAPGFIDLQVNGGGGQLFNDDPSVETIRQIYEAHKTCGTTNFLPTLTSAPLDKMLFAIDSVKRCMDHGEYGVLGLHLEGPYLNMQRAGVHDKGFIRKPAGELEYLLRHRDVIKVITLAPEIAGKDEIKLLSEAGIKVALGHSNCTLEQGLEAFDSGASLVTHLFNAMSQLQGREPGLVGAALKKDEVWNTVIADGFHVHFSSLSLCHRLKPAGKTILITDAMPPVGKGDMDFSLGNLQISCKDGKCTTPDGVLAGSGLDMAAAVRNCVDKVGISKIEALRMASTYPAQFLGLAKLGKVAEGSYANLVILDRELFVKGVVF